MAPDFIAQNGEPMTVEERRAWFDTRAEEMRAEGATWLQFAVDDADNPTVALVEGWRQQPGETTASAFSDGCRGRRERLMKNSGLAGRLGWDDTFRSLICGGEKLPGDLRVIGGNSVIFPGNSGEIFEG